MTKTRSMRVNEDEKESRMRERNDRTDISRRNAEIVR